MAELSIIRLPVAGGDPAADDAELRALLADWRHVHNTVIHTYPMSADELRERTTRNVLDVAYANGVLVGNMTVRPPGDDGTATINARVLPPFRGKGYGTALYERGLATARELGARAVETNILTSNEAGLRFALSRGFVEIDRYTPEGTDVPFADLRLVV